ncbi:alginate lyase family protein [Stakelama sp. CBK3Z-3]|uniref:Alginate lyase family protein n=1 Tax=Stakelama flava TaxID=2860338 RepID=A0ABS6XJB1_9SPHN|nr:alginate lyase family protein [Stakelama flava]MBW4329893.1 alginate lyase family protein [Stakelama flava]
MKNTFFTAASGESTLDLRNTIIRVIATASISDRVRSSTRWSASLLCLALAACGGGSSSNSSGQVETPTATATATPIPAPTPTPTPTPEAAAETTLSAPFAQPVAEITDLPECTDTPDPVVQLETISMYVTGDTTYSQIDPEKLAERTAMLKPITTFTAAVSHYANKYVESGGTDTDSGGCALAWLNAWAGTHAMTQMLDDESQFVRSVNLAAWALAYAQVKNLQVDRNAPHAAIETWLADMANDMRSYVDSLTDKTARNNHRYWAGLAAISVALDTGDSDLADWSVESAEIGISQITSEGALPLELERGSRAAHYHLYAAAPLVMTAAIAATKGVDLYAENDGALHRLVSFATSSVFSPDEIETLSGAEQEAFDITSSVGQQNLAWFEFYAKSFPDQAPAQDQIFKYRPLRNNEIGGDMTMLAQSLS